MSVTRSGLLEALQDPRILAALPPAAANRILRAAHRTRLLPRLAQALPDPEDRSHLHPAIQDRLTGADALGAQHSRALRWEIGQVVRALRNVDTPIVVLKGGAYLVADLPPSRGRLASDLDILVPRVRLDEVEAALVAAGWITDKDDPYDQRYYREWMHELPPMRHAERRSVLDVHHTIAPPTSRIRPDAEALIDGSRPVAGAGVAVPGPEDMVLHSATHLFHDGDLDHGLRDLLDLDDLLHHFGGSDAGFWDRLAARASHHGLQRPLYYTVRYIERILGTPMPEHARRAARPGRPDPVRLSLMDSLVATVMDAEAPEDHSRSLGAAKTALYIRSHWLRMPPWLLARHLTRKALHRDPDKKERGDAGP